MLYVKAAVIFFFACTALQCFGQAIDVAATVNPSYVFLNKHTDVFQASSLISLDSILQKPSQQKFTRLKNDKVLFKGYDPYFYWYRFTLYNSDTAAKEYVLLLGGLGIREAKLWKGENNNWVFLGSSGYKYPFTKRPYPYVHHAYPVLLQPRIATTFYISIDESHAYKTVAFVLAEPYKLKLLEHRFYYLSGISCGLLFLFFILNLYLYFSIKEKIHFWYALYIISILFFLIKNAGLDAEFLGLDSTFGYRGTYMGAVASLAICFLLQVVQLYLVNIKETSWLHRALSFLKWCGFGIAMIEFIVFYIQPDYRIETLLFEWANKTILFSFAFIIAACVYSFYKGFKAAIFILAGQLLFIIGGVARALFIGAETYMFPPSLFEIGLLVEVMVISYGLMYRYKQYKKEKEALKEKFEWQQIQITKQILMVQENERKRIAADLHDELGGNLAALKMNLQSLGLEPGKAIKTFNLIDQASVNARHISHNLMPPEFENTQLEDLLTSYFERLTTESNTTFCFYHSAKNVPFNKQEELIVYRIIMELTTNILKHAAATEATVQIICSGAFVELMVEDNGKGFQQKEGSGIGLSNVQSRVAYLNAKMMVDSGVKGTTITIQIPLKIE